MTEAQSQLSLAGRKEQGFSNSNYNRQARTGAGLTVGTSEGFTGRREEGGKEEGGRTGKGGKEFLWSFLCMVEMLYTR